MSVKASFCVNFIIIFCIFLCACSNNGEPSQAGLESTLTETSSNELTSKTPTINSQIITPTDENTSTAGIQTSQETRFSERREILASTDIWSEEFRAKTFKEKIDFLQTLFPDGLYWNSNDSSSINNNDQKELMISEKACNHYVAGQHTCNGYSSVLSRHFPFGDYNIQCLAFANMFSDIIYGKDAGSYEFYDYESLEPGDTIRLLNDDHSVIVINKNDEYISVAECNADYKHCQIKWGRQISRQALSGGSAMFLKRTVQIEP